MIFFILRLFTTCAGVGAGWIVIFEFDSKSADPLHIWFMGITLTIAAAMNIADRIFPEE